MATATETVRAVAGRARRSAVRNRVFRRSKNPRSKKKAAPITAGTTRAARVPLNTPRKP
jgi:hypothetical protein